MKKLNLIIVGIGLMTVVGLAGKGIATADIVSPLPQFNVIKAYEQVGRGKASLLNYKNSVSGKIEKIQREVKPDEKIFITITLVKPASEDQVANLINNFGLSVRHLKGRFNETDTGLRGTIGLTPVNGNPFGSFSEVFTGNNDEFQGFIEIMAEVPNKNLKPLINNPLVYLADPTADNHLVYNPKNNPMPGVFWSLEDTGMVAQ